MFLNYFYIFNDFKHLCSYRLYSYYEKCVTSTPRKLGGSHHGILTPREDKCIYCNIVFMAWMI